MNKRGGEYMLQIKNSAMPPRVRFPEDLGMDNNEYNKWKELVQMNSVQMSKHASHWISRSSLEFHHF